MVLLIAHRGNTNGPNKVMENEPEYIKKAITKQIINRQSEGFEIAADVTEFLIQKKKWWRAVKILGIK